MPKRLRTSLALFSLSAAACAEAPLAGPGLPPPTETLAEVRCTVTVAGASIRCGPEAPGAARDLLVVGGQHRYVRLAGSAVAWDSAGDALTATVTVQNLLLTAIGTADGGTPDPEGVRVFFASGPTHGVSVDSADGTAGFTAASQPYYRYAGADLGPDEILSPAETSAGRGWRFDLNGASAFSFTVYVAAQVPAGSTYAAAMPAVATGGEYTCSLDAAGQAYCWGGDAFGKLGNGPAVTDARLVPWPVSMPPGVHFTSLGLGLNHGCALAGDSTAYCWGVDANGRLGNGPASTAAMDQPSAVEMPVGARFTAIAAGTAHSCAIGAAGEGYCWGSDASGQLGNGAAGGSDLPTGVAMPAGVSFARVVAGDAHSCALDPGGAAYCWGSNATGQLGIGDSTVAAAAEPQPVSGGLRFSAIATTLNTTCGLTTGGAVVCWGPDNAGQLGNGAATGNRYAPEPVGLPAGTTVTSLGVGMQHACVLASGGGAYCWGWDAGGVLGNGPGSTARQDLPSAVEMPAGVAFTAVHAGRYQSCARSASGLYCWGSSYNGQVGDGTTLDRSAPVVVAGTR